ncbi:MAG: PLP-dependent aminotransferase family protein [Chloroflexota bacterium]
MTFTLRSTQIEVPEGMIDFGVGQPGPSTLPGAIIQQAMAHRAAQEDALYLSYGPEQGDGQFLECLADFLSNEYGLPVAPTSLMVSGGASQALDLIVSYFSQPGDTIFVEEPTYFLALPIFRERGLNVVGLPMDEGGLIIEALEEALKEHSPRFVYTIPVHHNPSSVTLSAERRQKLVRLSEIHNFYILADEVYQLLTYTSAPPIPFGTMIESERVFSLGSFSKILGPGLRLGWIQAGPTLLEQLMNVGFVFSGGSLNQFSSHIVRSALELGLQQQFLTTIRQTYRDRSDALCQAIREHLGETVSFRTPTGGYFLWAKFPQEANTSDWLRAAAEHQVRFQPGINFSSDSELKNYMRFCFAHYTREELVEGVKRLAAALKTNRN